MEQIHSKAQKSGLIFFLLFIAAVSLLLFAVIKGDEAVAKDAEEVSYVMAKPIIVDSDEIAEIDVISITKEEPVPEDVLETSPAESKANSSSAKTENVTVYKRTYSANGIPLSDGELDVLLKACEQYGVDPALALSVMDTESSFNPNAVNKDGTCFSYMQINKVNETWLKNDLGISSVKNPEDNIKAGVYIIAGYLNKYGDAAKALMCYNHGEGGAQSKFKNGVYQTGYTNTVLGKVDAYTELLNGKKSEEPTPAVSPETEAEAAETEAAIVQEPAVPGDQTPPAASEDAIESEQILPEPETETDTEDAKTEDIPSAENRAEGLTETPSDEAPAEEPAEDLAEEAQQEVTIAE